MFAILKSLYWIEDSPYTKVMIISDSLSSLISIESHSSRSNPALLLEVLISLRRLWFKNVYVMFLWVPSHIGILGNEKADRSAAKALHHKNVYQLPLELRDIYAIIDIHILKLWQGMWDNNHSNIYY